MPLISRFPKSSAEIERRLMQYARSEHGLTWRRVHDAFSGDDRLRAKAVFDQLTRPRGPLHARTSGRATWYFASSAQASAWQPPRFNELHGLESHIHRTPRKGMPPPMLAGTPGRGEKHKKANGATMTVCPAPKWDHRYQIDPETRVVGGFASLGMGRYLDE